jgi:hypothetical protein
MSTYGQKSLFKQQQTTIDTLNDELLLKKRRLDKNNKNKSVSNKDKMNIDSHPFNNQLFHNQSKEVMIIKQQSIEQETKLPRRII